MAVIEEVQSKTTAPAGVATAPTKTNTAQTQPAKTLQTDAAPMAPKRVGGLSKSASPASRLITQPDTGASADRLRLTYTVLLGAAACLALIGVVVQDASADPGSPDAPPPAVLEQGS